MNEGYTLTRQYMDVCLPLPLFTNFTYSVPEELRGRAKIGARVLVPFGRRVLTGYAVGESERTDLEVVRDILDVVDDVPLLTPALYRLAQWMGSYYMCPLGTIIKTILPAGLVRESRVNASLSDRADFDGEFLKSLTPGQRKVLGLLVSKSPRTVSSIRKSFSRERISGSVWSIVSSLERKGLISTEQVIKGDVSAPRKTRIITLAGKRLQLGREREQLLGRSPRQKECYEWMESVRSPVELQHLTRRVGFSQRVIQSLVDKGLLAVEEKDEEPSLPDIQPDGFGTGWASMVPTDDQILARDRILDSVNNRKGNVFLLYGVTGSGKTVVYLEVLKEVLRKGFSAIVLVPEISLTPQTISRFREVFPGLVSTVHSHLSPRERFEAWVAAREGRVKILVGARSAVFSPIENLGVIIIDEEHETSYKQEDTPRYHARNVAIKRAELQGATVILGSATPSLESFHHAIQGAYRLLRLPHRIGQRNFPDIHIVDMKQEEGFTIISKRLKREVGNRVGRGEQVMLFLNRRGYSSYLQCGSCGWVGYCSQCDISLTLHRRPLYLGCHYCDHREEIPDECPRCKSTTLLFRGVGTERVDREIKNMFPDAHMERMDLDTTSGKWSHRDILEKFLRGDTDILLGTQMIAKGLDFPNVTLVGVINADTGLNLPDFRSEEKSFQILMQVSGRTARGELGGDVLIQTYLSDSPVIEAVQEHDFERFAEAELEARNAAEYPPFFSLANVIVQGKEEKEVSNAAVNVVEALNGYSSPVRTDVIRVVGPAPCVHRKLRGMYRWHILLKSRDPGGMSRILSDFIDKWHQGKGGIKVIVDRDPMSLM